MKPDTRALVAACAFALLTDKKVAGLYDHAAGRRRKIAAERRGNQVQAFDGDRAAAISGALPELFNAGDQSYIAFELTGDPVRDGVRKKVRGHDRHSNSDFEARAVDDALQLYDYAEGAWFAFDIQNPDAAKSFYR